jgi:hypothetical protein
MKPAGYKFALGLTLATSLILAWLSLGVGIIGADGDRANIMFFGVLAVGVVGAIASRLRPGGMARTLFAMAMVQAGIAGYAVVSGLGLPWSGPAEILLLNAFFVAMFCASGWMFRRAARVTR